MQAQAVLGAPGADIREGAVGFSIREKTKRTRGDSLARIVADLNRSLGGWFGYFKHAHPYTFVRIDQFVRRPLRAILRKQEKRPGFRSLSG